MFEEGQLALDPDAAEEFADRMRRLDRAGLGGHKVWQVRKGPSPARQKVRDEIKPVRVAVCRREL